MNFDGHLGDSQRFRGPYSKVSHYKALQKADQLSLAQTWHNIVQWYTKLNITYHSDRLPGRSGLAKQVASRRWTRYLAGLWEDSLPFDLLWRPISGSLQLNATKMEKSQTTKAPSWSWASCPRSLLFPLNSLSDNTLDTISGYFKKTYPTSISAHVEPATLNLWEKRASCLETLGYVRTV